MIVFRSDKRSPPDHSKHRPAGVLPVTSPVSPQPTPRSAMVNPFASFIEIVRAPLLNEAPAAQHYLFAIICTVVGWTIALPFYARFRGRILYWL